MSDGSSSERYERGWQRLLELNRGQDPTVVRQVAGVSPEISRLIVEFGYGDVYDSGALAAPQRQLLTIAMLTTLGGCERQLEVHVAGALNVGVSAQQILASLVHALPFAGFPRVLNALDAARVVFERRGIDPTAT